MKALSELPALFPTCDTGSCREDFQSSAADYFHFGLVCIRHKLRGRFRHFHGNRSALGGSCELELKFPPHLNEKKRSFHKTFYSLPWHEWNCISALKESTGNRCRRNRGRHFCNICLFFATIKKKTEENDCTIYTVWIKLYVNLNCTILEQAPSLTTEMYRRTQAPCRHSTLPSCFPQITLPLTSPVE